MLPAGHPLFTLAVILIAGVVAGRLAKRARLPAVTGQVVIGVLLGPSALGALSVQALHDLRPLTSFALGLIAVTVGNHLNLSRLRHAWRRLGLLLLFEVLVTPALVFAAVRLGGVRDWTVGLMFAAMAVATAPATIIAVVKDAHARGVFVKTLIAAVALNNMACILLFEVARSLAHHERDGWIAHPAKLVAGPVTQLLAPIVLGLAVGGALVVVTRRIARSDLLASSSIIAIVFTVGLSEIVEISPLLSCLFLGVALANLTPDKDEVGHRVFQNFEGAVFAVFFTLAGMELDFAYLPTAGVLALLFVAARAAGKILAASGAMTLSDSTTANKRYLGPALLPQAGVAVGLVILVVEDAALVDVAEVFLTVGITSVAINEIVGPIAARWALGRSGEVGRDRPRLIDFLHEDHIVTDLGHVTMESALDRLAGHLVRTHDVAFKKEELVGALLAQEDHGLTYIGRGLAIPHARLGSGRIVGVMGISREGLVATTTDGERVHCVVLMATPEDQSDRHLEVLAAFAKAIGGDHTIEHELYAARKPSHAYELLHAQDADDFNYFLDEVEG